ncbi:early endosome antigen 1 [Fistulifera solaris]|uniref:Early endosome antigen 1 n=1 Tax=Fistulifera solaris TaxID=1519565 RepID=A0A1Z5JU27_FISSO|nr:early endosome antigen 1 [Fistulifera solaris]|eukprot:GAX17288.1 early endosome antigen 1 [Fistulifera solaris]
MIVLPPEDVDEGESILNEPASVLSSNHRPASVATLSSPWQFDDLAKHCSGCKSIFNAMNRKHHCRMCGKIFCGKCSQQKALIPPSSIVLTPEGGKKAKPRSALHDSFSPDEDPDRMLTYLAADNKELLYGKGLEERFKLAREPLRVCQSCYQQLSPLQEDLRNSNSNAMRFNYIDPTDPRRLLNSPLAFTLGHEIRKAAYTLNNLLPLPKRMGIVISSPVFCSIMVGLYRATGINGQANPQSRKDVQKWVFDRASNRFIPAKTVNAGTDGTDSASTSVASSCKQEGDRLDLLKQELARLEEQKLLAEIRLLELRVKKRKAKSKPRDDPTRTSNNQKTQRNGQPRSPVRVQTVTTRSSPTRVSPLKVVERRTQPIPKVKTLLPSSPLKKIPVVRKSPTKVVKKIMLEPGSASTSTSAATQARGITKIENQTPFPPTPPPSTQSKTRGKPLVDEDDSESESSSHALDEVSPKGPLHNVSSQHSQLSGQERPQSKKSHSPVRNQASQPVFEDYTAHNNLSLDSSSSSSSSSSYEVRRPTRNERLNGAAVPQSFRSAEKEEENPESHHSRNLGHHSHRTIKQLSFDEKAENNRSAIGNVNTYKSENSTIDTMNSGDESIINSACSASFSHSKSENNAESTGRPSLQSSRRQNQLSGDSGDSSIDSDFDSNRAVLRQRDGRNLLSLLNKASESMIIDAASSLSDGSAKMHRRNNPIGQNKRAAHDISVTISEGSMSVITHSECSDTRPADNMRGKECNAEDSSRLESLRSKRNRQRKQIEERFEKMLPSKIPSFQLENGTKPLSKNATKSKPLSIDGPSQYPVDGASQINTAVAVLAYLKQIHMEETAKKFQREWKDLYGTLPLSHPTIIGTIRFEPLLTDDSFSSSTSDPSIVNDHIELSLDEEMEETKDVLGNFQCDGDEQHRAIDVQISNQVLGKEGERFSDASEAVDVKQVERQVFSSPRVQNPVLSAQGDATNNEVLHEEGLHQSIESVSEECQTPNSRSEQECRVKAETEKYLDNAEQTLLSRHFESTEVLSSDSLSHHQLKVDEVNHAVGPVSTQQELDSKKQLVASHVESALVSDFPEDNSNPPENGDQSAKQTIPSAEVETLKAAGQSEDGADDLIDNKTEILYEMTTEIADSENVTDLPITNDDLENHIRLYSEDITNQISLSGRTSADKVSEEIEDHGKYQNHSAMGYSISAELREVAPNGSDYRGSTSDEYHYEDQANIAAHSISETKSVDDLDILGETAAVASEFNQHYMNEPVVETESRTYVAFANSDERLGENSVSNDVDANMSQNNGISDAKITDHSDTRFNSQIDGSDDSNRNLDDRPESRHAVHRTGKYIDESKSEEQGPPSGCDAQCDYVECDLPTLEFQQSASVQPTFKSPRAETSTMIDIAQFEDVTGFASSESGQISVAVGRDTEESVGKQDQLTTQEIDVLIPCNMGDIPLSETPEIASSSDACPVIMDVPLSSPTRTCLEDDVPQPDTSASTMKVADEPARTDDDQSVVSDYSDYVTLVLDNPDLDVSEISISDPLEELLLTSKAIKAMRNVEKLSYIREESLEQEPKQEEKVSCKSIEESSEEEESEEEEESSEESSASSEEETSEEEGSSSEAEESSTEPEEMSNEFDESSSDDDDDDDDDRYGTQDETTEGDDSQNEERLSVPLPKPKSSVPLPGPASDEQAPPINEPEKGRGISVFHDRNLVTNSIDETCDETIRRPTPPLKRSNSEGSIVASPHLSKKRSLGRSVSFDDDITTVEVPRWDEETKKALFYDSVDLRGFKMTEKARQERKASEKIAKQMNSTIGAATVGMPSFFDGL